MTKRYNSVTTIAFTVHHDDKDEPTADEYWNGLLRRFGDLLLIRETNYNEIFEIVDAELNDTLDDFYEQGLIEEGAL
jgi:hypothetical protein